MYSKNDILEFLKEYYQEKKDKYHIKKIGIFGSYSRNEANENSDIDIVVDLEQSKMFNLIAIKEDIKEYFKKDVDIVQIREKMNPLLKKRIQKDAIYV
jgi:predicted nucleotidyltransferase